MATVLLVRHGETDWNRNRLVQGWAPVALNERGREQARAVGAHLGNTYDIDSVIASDLRRTRETAALVGQSGVKSAPVFERDWRERGFGVFQGLDYESVFGEHPEYDVASGNTDALTVRPENGESLLDLRERVLRGWEAVLRRVGVAATGGDEVDRTGGIAGSDRDSGTLGTGAGDHTALVVTHGGPIYVLLAHLDGIDLPTVFDREHQANCALNEISVEATGSDTGSGPEVEIVRRNDTSYRED